MVNAKNERDQTRWLFAKNMTGERVPAHGCCLLAEIDTASTSTPTMKAAVDLDPAKTDRYGFDVPRYRYYAIYKPSEDCERWPDNARLVFNGPNTIYTDDWNCWGRVTADLPAMGLMEANEADTGDDLRPIADSFYLKKCRRGPFRCIDQDPYVRFKDDSITSDPVDLAVVHIARAQHERIDATDVIMVRNGYSDRVAGEVLELGARLSTQQPNVAVGTRDLRRIGSQGSICADNPRRIAVLLEDAKSGETRPAVASGVVPIMVNVEQLYHPRAYPVKNQAYLKSGWAGPAQLLEVPASTGTQILNCLLDQGNSSVAYWAKTPTGGIAAATYGTNYVTPGSATCDLWCWDEDNSRYAPMAGKSAAILNNASGSVPGSSLIRASSDQDWKLVVDVEFCTNGFSA